MGLANAGRNYNKHNKSNKPSFNEVAEKEEVVQEDNQNNAEESDTVDDIVNSVIHSPKPKAKEQVSIYLDSDVKKAFERWGKKNGKGSRSDLINSFLKKALDI